MSLKSAKNTLVSDLMNALIDSNQTSKENKILLRKQLVDISNALEKFVKSANISIDVPVLDLDLNKDEFSASLPTPNSTSVTLVNAPGKTKERKIESSNITIS